MAKEELMTLKEMILQEYSKGQKNIIIAVE